MEELPVQLGFLGDIVSPSNQVTSADSIAGGDPAWDATLGPPPETMRSCGSCGDPLVQLLQIPTDTNTLQRTVYLLVCNKNRCQGAHGCMRAVRFQRPWPGVNAASVKEANCSDESENEKSRERSAGTPEGTGSGCGAAAGADDWGAGGGADDWNAQKCDDTRVHGCGVSTEPGSQGTGGTKLTGGWDEESRFGGVKTSEDGGGIEELEAQLSKLTAARQTPLDAGAGAGTGEGGGGRRRRKKKGGLSGGERGEAREGGAGSMDVEAKDFVPVLAEIFNAGAKERDGRAGGCVGLPCFAVDWDSEPKTAVVDPDMSRYEKMGQEALAAWAAEGGAAGAGSGAGIDWVGEEHESEGDKTFRRFRKRVARAPQQVLRYCWGGEPLWQSAVGQPQAMPALLHYLDVESAAPPGDAGMDCAVAAVYSCVASCGADGVPDAEGYEEETCLVQRDSV